MANEYYLERLKEEIQNAFWDLENEDLGAFTELY